MTTKYSDLFVHNFIIGPFGSRGKFNKMVNDSNGKMYAKILSDEK